MNIAGQLIAAGADPQEICNHVYYNLPPSTMKLIGRVLNGIEFHCQGKLCILTLSRKMLAEAGADAAESDGLVDFTLYTKGVQTGALLKEIDSKTTKASLRSVDGINVSAIAARYGGGGHYNAAGCTMPYSLDKAKTQLLDCLTEICNEAN